MRVAIRERASDEAANVPAYVLVNPETGWFWTVFGIIQGGETREEAVFWAERLASKNGLDYDAPSGWEDVVGALPERES